MNTKKINKYKIKLNKFGFYSLQENPSKEELEEYYSKKYYQIDRTTYQKKYSKEEILYINNKIEQKYYLIQKLLSKKNKFKLLDIGCGEGFCLAFFKKRNWNVTGIDFSKFGLEIHNPDMGKYAICGDVYESIKTLKAKKEKFDLIWIDNVLEHVVKPSQLLKDCYEMTSGSGILFIEVPNDFSRIQMESKKLLLVNKDFWLAPPEHISYFNREGLVNICNKSNWNVQKIIADFPIDFNLFNPNANYIKNKKTGKGAHLQRLLIDNLMHKISIDKTNNYYEALADLGLGRSIIAILKK